MPFFFYFFLFRSIIHLFSFVFVSALFLLVHSENQQLPQIIWNPEEQPKIALFILVKRD